MSQALMDALAFEHAAVALYAVLGGRAADDSLGSPLGPSFGDAYRQHRARRDLLRALLNRAELSAPAAEPAYALPSELITAAELKRAAQDLESRACAAYLLCIEVLDADQRAWAVTALLDAATRLVEFGGRPQAFPGVAAPS